MSAEGWPGIWPMLTMLGAWLLAGGGVVMLFGAAADFAGNRSLSDLLIFWIGAPPAAVGATVFFLGFGGWWTVAVVAVFVGFGWLVRPRPTQLT